MATPNSGNPSNIAELPAKQLSNGGGFVGILQPDERIAFIANVPAAASAPTKAEYDALATAFNTLKAGLVTVGVMKSS